MTIVKASNDKNHRLSVPALLQKQHTIPLGNSTLPSGDAHREKYLIEYFEPFMASLAQGLAVIRMGYID